MHPSHSTNNHSHFTPRSDDAPPTTNTTAAQGASSLTNTNTNQALLERQLERDRADSTLSLMGGGNNTTTNGECLYLIFLRYTSNCDSENSRLTQWNVRVYALFVKACGLQTLYH